MGSKSAMDDDEIIGLIDLYIDDSIDRASLERLKTWLRADKDNVRAFVRRMMIHRQLRETLVIENSMKSLQAATESIESPPLDGLITDEKRIATAVPATPVPTLTEEHRLGTTGPLIDTGTSPSWRSVSIFLSGVAFSLVGICAWWLWHGKSGDHLDQRPSNASAPIAYLTAANDCGWGTGTPELWTVGRTINSGDELTLHEGVAEFRLANDVSLGIEGPASFLLASPSTLVLQYGKLTAHVPAGVSDFKVVAAGCRIVAGDAEFGVNLTGNKLEIHVFSGEVTAASSITSMEFDDELATDSSSSAAGENYFTESAITAGRALRLTSHGEVLKIAGWGKAKPSSFVAKLSMSGPLSVTQAYIDQVKSSQPVGYWRFGRIAKSSIPNEIDSGAPLIVGNKSSRDNRAEKRSAEFRSNSDLYISTESSLPLGKSEYSIEAWVKPNHVHLGTVVILDCKDGHNSGAAIELQGGAGESFGRKHPGELRYLHRTYKGKTDAGSSCFSSSPYAVRRWQHVVAVKDEARMKLYLDGKQVGSYPIGGFLPNDVQVLVGVDRSYTNRRFVGQLDELAVYDRALTEQEIARHYAAVKPATKTSN